MQFSVFIFLFLFYDAYSKVLYVRVYNKQVITNLVLLVLFFFQDGMEKKCKIARAEC